MNLLPKTTSEFSESHYWNSFFQQRGKKAFEWYGEYQDLCQHLHKYMKYKDQILMVGCGNSKLSRSLYEVGFGSIISIDNSRVVIKQMNSSHADIPSLQFLEMDALNTSFDNEAFSVVLDKGTLDAMMTDDKDETLVTIRNYFNEMSRLLRLGGRYICISLLQEHVLRALLQNFSTGWMVRIIHCFSGDSSHPVFIVVATKLRPLPSSPPLMLEIGLTDYGKLVKVENIDAACEMVKTHQQAAFICDGVKKGSLNGDEVVFEVSNPDSKKLKYTVTVVDKKPDKKGVRRLVKYAAFVVPRGREDEYMFCCEEGRQELIVSMRLDRIALIVCHEKLDLETVKFDLSNLIKSLAPSSAPGPSYPILTSNDDTGFQEEKTIVAEGISPLSGKYTIADQEISPGVRVRSLVFQDNPRLVQSQATLKQVKSRRGKKFVVDVGILNCQHHGFMTVGVCLALPSVESEGSILVIGVGGGALCGYLHKLFQNCSITGVDIDPAMVEVATNHFGLKTDSRLQLEVSDGLQFMKDAAAAGKKYDAILFDVDNKDVSVGMSCPPASFVEPSVLAMTHSLLNPKGLLVVNLVARSESLRKEVYKSLNTEFGRLIWVQVDEEVGQIVFCKMAQLKPAISRLQEAISNAGFPSLTQLTSYQDYVYP